MRTPRLVFTTLALVLACSSPIAAKEKPVDVKRTLAHVLPDKSDLAWSKIPWHATLWDAVIEANTKKKPILLWAMNGHALACT